MPIFLNLFNNGTFSCFLLSISTFIIWFRFELSLVVHDSSSLAFLHSVLAIFCCRGFTPVPPSERPRDHNGHLQSSGALWCMRIVHHARFSVKATLPSSFFVRVALRIKSGRNISHPNTPPSNDSSPTKALITCSSSLSLMRLPPQNERKASVRWMLASAGKHMTTSMRYMSTTNLKRAQTSTPWILPSDKKWAPISNLCISVPDLTRSLTSTFSKHSQSLLDLSSTTTSRFSKLCK